MPPIDTASQEDIEECKQRVQSQGRVVLDNNQVDYNTGYANGKLDAQLGKFGSTSMMPINENTILTAYVQGYLKGYYDTYIIVGGVAPW